MVQSNILIFFGFVLRRSIARGAVSAGAKRTVPSLATFHHDMTGSSPPRRLSSTIS
jgi:hypothetical protein